MSHVTHINESCGMSHVTHKNESCVTSRVTHMNESRAMGHVTHINESCVMGYVTHILTCPALCYGVATISRLLKSIGLFCKRALQKRPIFSKETYNFKEPTNRSHPIVS